MHKQEAGKKLVPGSTALLSDFGPNFSLEQTSGSTCPLAWQPSARNYVIRNMALIT
jgi:hypothetical protein